MRAVVIYAPKYPDGIMSKCRHPGAAALVVNGRLVRGRVESDCVVCMDCGCDVTGKMTRRDALAAAMAQHGWHMAIGKRLCRLAAGADENPLNTHKETSTATMKPAGSKRSENPSEESEFHGGKS